MGKKRTASSSAKEVHKQSLSEQLADPETYGIRTKVRPPKKSKRSADDEADEAAVRPEQSSVILSLAREQQEEEDRETAKKAMGGHDIGMLLSSAKRAVAAADSDDDDDDAWDVAEGDFDDTQDLYTDDLDTYTRDDEAAFNAFMQKDSGGQGLLADVIAAKMREKEAQRACEGDDMAAGEDAGVPEGSGIDEKMESVYTDVGKLLSRYTTGKLPKAFKIIPHLRNWEEIIFITDPESWSPHATFAATKIFVSQLNTKQTQRFLNLVLLNKVRDDIRRNRRLHFALFQAVKKAVFKPGAFYKGLVLPLLQAGDCTLREAVIFSSILTRVSIPVDHSSAALLRMADMPYSGVTSFFIKTLLDKKYSLPYRVIDALVDHFVSFRGEERTLPVIWHLCLLTFIQRYKHEIRSEEKELFRALLKVQAHSQVTPEIHRELNHGRNRGEKPTDGSAMDVQTYLPSCAAEDPFKMAQVVMEECD